MGRLLDSAPMSIDFSFPEELQLVISKVRDFCDQVVRPAEKVIDDNEGDRKVLVEKIIEMRKAAREWGLWLPHMPEEYGGMGLGHVAMAAVSAEAARTRFGPFALNAQAPDEGNMHTLHHWGTAELKEKAKKFVDAVWLDGPKGRTALKDKIKAAEGLPEHAPPEPHS